jgi:hypothetical protein
MKRLKLLLAGISFVTLLATPALTGVAEAGNFDKMLANRVE